MISKFKEKLLKSGELYIKIKGRPGASETKIKGILRAENEEIVKIDVAVIPEKGKANAELIRFLAEEFAISVKNVKIVSGASDKFKLIRIIKINDRKGK
jgi:uncharacterized protein (TIGR00251 family)